jgi:hypothetical protein
VPSPDITANGMFVGQVAPTSTVRPLYNWSDCPTSLSVVDMRKFLGDSNFNGAINAGETPSWTGPFLLWGAGPDGAYGLDLSVPPKTDDVTNFTIPAQYLR